MSNDIDEMRNALIKAHEFLMFAWRDISMNEYAENMRSDAELAVYDAILIADRLTGKEFK